MSSEYAVGLTRAAIKEIARLPPKIRGQIDRRLEELRVNPRPHDSQRLVGRTKGYRLDMGEYRILYDVDDTARVVAVWRVRHRKDVYRNL
jgi:mRNA interferase RelE/StbE